MKISFMFVETTHPKYSGDDKRRQTMASADNSSIPVTVAAPKTTKASKTKAKPLLDELCAITDQDFALFSYRLEVDPNKKSDSYGREYKLAYKVEIPKKTGVGDEDKQYFEINQLTVIQMRAFARQLGVSNCGSMNKFDIRKSIANTFLYREKLHKAGISAGSSWARSTNTVCRAINVVFSSEFVDDFLKTNDRKVRRDHETANTFKTFWIRACDAFNAVDVMSDHDSDDDSDDSHDQDNENEVEDGDPYVQMVVPDGDGHLFEYMNSKEFNLKQVDHLQTDAFRKKITTLFKIRRVIKANMTQSGTHDNEAWNFVQAAMKGMSGVTKEGAYYFYLRCEATPGIDAHFQPFMPSHLKGSSVAIGDDGNEGNDDEDNDSWGVSDGMIGITLSTDGRSTGSSYRKKKRAKLEEEHIGQLVQHSQEMMHLMAKSHEMQRESHEMQRQSHALERDHNDIKLEIECARALGDTDTLRQLMKEAQERRQKNNSL